MSYINDQNVYVQLGVILNPQKDQDHKTIVRLRELEPAEALSLYAMIANEQNRPMLTTRSDHECECECAEWSDDEEEEE
ncbi:hypothetical protein [Phytoactinopolyspora halotolerans]|uniref:Uncharacterized protein n=1 Tax=Phytoactinopolyspora halotolerans TaxID=1981512 RepID=A0A6L9SK47_9ACTN|nr:hypothetical protein [Phytoactinopolyspora halotolerans]NEE04752.1 hypothetical protein [Phytoactinopolyspora halotolerans]